MILQIIKQIFGIMLFFIIGVLFSYLTSSKTDIIKRVVCSLVFAVSISMIIAILLYLLNLLTAMNYILSLLFLAILFFVIVLKSKNKKYKTNFNKDIFYILLFSLIGAIWRFLFVKSIKNFGGAYTYSGKFFGETIPDLGFYTGMAIDHSRFIGNYVFAKISGFLLLEKFFDNFGIFLITFLFLGLIYMIFCEYRSKELAYLAVALMALGPIEIFHTTLGFFGHSFSYIALFSLFLLYKLDDKSYGLIALLLSTTVVFTYFTSAMINALASTGFIIALFTRDLINNKNIKKTIKNFFRNRKILYFILIAVVSFSFIFSSFSSKERSSSNTELIIEHITTYPIIKYGDPTFLGLSAIRWQMLFFFLCGLTFIFYLARKRDFSENSIDISLCLIPILIVSCAFLYTNAPTRIFNYFAFFGLLALKIQKKYLKTFFVLSFIFILTTSFYVAKDKKIFFETSDKEIEGAIWINNSLQGRIFSDQPFINQLILNGYYNVTGANDDDLITYNLFYQDDSSIFLDTINTLDINLSVDYIVLTKRMQEQYILMLNVPQKPLKNLNPYEENLNKVYDNGDVKVYEIKKIE